MSHPRTATEASCETKPPKIPNYDCSNHNYKYKICNVVVTFPNQSNNEIGSNTGFMIYGTSRGIIVANVSACHVEDPGSIPGQRGVLSSLILLLAQKPLLVCGQIKPPHGNGRIDAD